MTILPGRGPSGKGWPAGLLRCPVLAIALLGACVWSAIAADSRPAAENATCAAGPAGFIRVDGRDLQQVIDQAPPNSTILCDPNRQITRSVPFKIAKPLTLRGLNARLPAKLGNTSLVVVTAKGVTISDFVLTGNGDTASQDERAPLMAIGAGDFRIEHGRFVNGSKDGVMIDGDLGGGGDIVGGVVRDIVGQEVIRDTVSISGSGGGDAGGHIRNVLVDNIRCYHSDKRGCVEVSDGTDNITVRKVYAENSVYAIDVQDHRKPSQVNRNVVLEDIYAWRCKHAIRTNNIALGHANLTVRDITAKECEAPIQISNTDHLSLYNVRVIDHPGTGKGYPLYLKNCHGVSVRDVTVENTGHKGPAMLVEDCDATLIDGFMLRGRNENLDAGICFRLTTGQACSGLRVSNVFARDVTDAGIVLEATGRKKGTLADYIISGNLARVQDRIQGQHAIIVNNLP